MFTSQTRSSVPHGSPGFAETQFLLDAGDDDYSGFAPTQVFEDSLEVEVPVLAGPTASPAAHAAAATSHSALAQVRAASVPAAGAAAVRDSVTPSGWATSQWVAAQEARAHEAADKARAVIAAQRRGDAAAQAPSGTIGGRSGVGRLLRGLLPLFIGVTVTVALISALLPLLDKP